MNKSKKFKLIEKDATIESKFHGKTELGNVEWEGEEVQAKSKTVLEDDRGTGTPVVIRFFDFGANPKVFKEHKPTAQELFDGHRKGMESLLWRDGLRPYEGVEPRLMFSKNKMHYRFIITCIPSAGNVLTDKTQTLSQLIK